MAMTSDEQDNREGAQDRAPEDAADDELQGAFAPGHERSVRLWQAFLRHQRVIGSVALVAVLVALLGAVFARQGLPADLPARQASPLALRAVAPAVQVSASSPYASQGVAPAGALVAYHLTQPGVGLMQPAVDARGDLWVGEMLPNRLTRIDHATGEAASWEPPNGRHNLTRVAIDRAGDVWFAEQLASYIGRFDPRTQTFTTYPLIGPNGGALQPQDLAFDARGALWFTLLGEGDGGAIGRLDPATGAITIWPTRDATARWRVRPFALTVTPAGEVWFGLLAGGAVGRLDPASGATTYYPLANPRATVFSMAAGAHGQLYFTELLDGKIGVIDSVRRTVTERAVPRAFGAPASLYGVVVGPDGEMWFASAGANALIRYEPARDLMTFYKLNLVGSVPFGLALDGKHRLWYSANGAQANYVGLLTV